MTHAPHSDAAPHAPGNVFLDKIALRLDVAADTLREFADSLDGRLCISSDEASDLRQAVAEVATSLQIVEALSRHFADDLTALGGISAGSLAVRSDVHHETAMTSAVRAALAGEVRA